MTILINIPQTNGVYDFNVGVDALRTNVKDQIKSLLRYGGYLDWEYSNNPPTITTDEGQCNIWMAQMIGEEVQVKWYGADMVANVWRLEDIGLTDLIGLYEYAMEEVRRIKAEDSN